MVRSQCRGLPSLLFLMTMIGGCASMRSGTVSDRGVASYYAHQYHGRTTASGEVFDMNALTAAHKTLPFGTRVKVTNLQNGKSVIVRINDRGPFVKGRTIDLSLAAARQIDMVQAGVVPVSLERIGGPKQTLSSVR